MNILNRTPLIPLLLLTAGGLANGNVVVSNLQVEYRKRPIGIDVTQPRFSWQMVTTADERGYEQTAYQIEVKDSKGNGVWDSGRIEGSASVGIRYAGAHLDPRPDIPG